MQENNHEPKVCMEMPGDSGDGGPLITTIIPTYRRPKMLRRTIKSVLNQTYPHFQVCVYDNASGDETASVIAEFANLDPRVKYHCHQENIGAGANFKYGAEHVETPFFSFLSDDDILLPDFYETALRGFKQHPEAIFSATGSIIMDTHGNILDVPVLGWKPGFYRPPHGLLAVLKYPHLVWTGIVFRREVIEKVGIVLDGTQSVSDSNFKYRIAARFPFVVCLEQGAIFLKNRSSYSTLNRLELYWWPGWLRLIQDLIEDRSIPPYVRAYAVHLMTKGTKKSLLSIGVHCVMQKKPKDACKISDILCKFFGLRTEALFLRIAAKLCKHIPPFRYFVSFLYHIWKRFGQKKYRLRKEHLQKEFGHYARFLEI